MDVKRKKKVEFKLAVFNAARDGDIDKLKFYFHLRPKVEVVKIISAYTDGTTPLIIACKNGYLKVVVYLLESNADIEQVGCIDFNGKSMDNVSPLWSAVSAGRLNVVKTLIGYKASVNSTTKTNSTPLHVACSQGLFKIVQYLVQHGADIDIQNGNDCSSLMIACMKGNYEISKYLLECGADVSRKNDKGNTALHECAILGNLEILKLLLKHGAKTDCLDAYGITPLLSAAVEGNSCIVDHFIEDGNCAKMEKINSLELLGSTLLDKKEDIIGAINRWRKAMEIRYEDIDFPLEKPCTGSPFAEYLNAAEVHSFLQLEEIVSNLDEMWMQALLIRERIIGHDHPSNIYYIRKRGLSHYANYSFGRCIQFWNYALDTQQKIHMPLNTKTLDTVKNFVEFFSNLISIYDLNNLISILSFRDIFNVFLKVVKEIEAYLELPINVKRDCADPVLYDRILITAVHVVGLLLKLQPHFTNSEEVELKQAVYSFVHLNPKTMKGLTPLHLACSTESHSFLRYNVVTYPSLEIVDLLLGVGACPNAMDISHNTPLHVAGMTQPINPVVFSSLLKHGSHLDFRNCQGNTPVPLTDGTTLCSKIPHIEEDLCPLHYMNLQCFSAQIIQKHNVPYKDLVHETLREFIDSH